MPRRTALGIESLDRRDLPSLFGVPWANAQQLTLSFATDGVPVATDQVVSAGQTSGLFAELNGSMATAAWQTEVLRAFQTWAAPANINIGLVADSGGGFGPEAASAALPAGGDLRVGAVPLSASVAAITTPYHLLAGNRAGDVLLNTNHSYSAGGFAGTRDLYSVALNEAANALGIEDSLDTASARYGRYVGVRTGLGPSDAAFVQSMYGSRPADAFEGTTGNATFATAATLTPVLPAGSTTDHAATADAQLTTAADLDVYKFVTRADTTSVTVRLNAAGRSLLTGKVEVFNAAQQLVASKATTDPLTNDLLVTVTGAAKSATYFVRASAGRSDAFGVGAYQLQVGLNGDPRPFAPAVPAAFTTYAADGGTDDTIATAKAPPTAAGAAANTRFAVRAGLATAADVDTYRLTAPATGNPLSVSLDPLTANTMTPEVRAFRGTGTTAVPAVKLVQSAGGRWAAQFPGLAAGETVYLQVRARDGSTGAGEYRLTADFTAPEAGTKTLLEGQTSAADPSHAVAVTVPVATYFHFGLRAWNVPGSGAGTHARLTIENASGQVVRTLSAGDGGIASAQVLLDAGDYVVRVAGTTAAGAAGPGARYAWTAARLSNPIDVLNPLDEVSLTQPVTISPLNPADDPGLILVAAPWTDPIG